MCRLLIQCVAVLQFSSKVKGDFLFRIPTYILCASMHCSHCHGQCVLPALARGEEVRREGGNWAGSKQIMHKLLTWHLRTFAKVGTPVWLCCYRGLQRNNIKNQGICDVILYNCAHISQSSIDMHKRAVFPNLKPGRPILSSNLSIELNFNSM